LGANRLLVQGARRLGANRLGGNTTRYPFIDSSSCTDRIISEILDHFFQVSVNEQKVVLILTFRGELYLKSFSSESQPFCGRRGACSVYICLRSSSTKFETT